MFKRLLVATELVDFCAAPVLTALKIAAQSDAQLSILHVLESETTKNRRFVKHFRTGEEIVTNAISSATRDPRFLPVSSDELEDLEYSVDVLTTPEPVKNEDQLDPKRYGVIVEAGWRRGLLLPVDFDPSDVYQRCQVG